MKDRGLTKQCMRLHRAAHLSLEVQESEGFELYRGFGPQVARQRARQVLELCNTMSNSRLQPEGKERSCFDYELT